MQVIQTSMILLKTESLKHRWSCLFKVSEERYASNSHLVLLSDENNIDLHWDTSNSDQYDFVKNKISKAQMVMFEERYASNSHLVLLSDENNNDLHWSGGLITTVTCNKG